MNKIGDCSAFLEWAIHTHVMRTITVLAAVGLISYFLLGVPGLSGFLDRASGRLGGILRSGPAHH